MLVKRKRIFLISAFLLVAAITIVLLVSGFTKDVKDDYKGTLVEELLIETIV